MIDKEALRATALQDSEAYETKKRFGLFSHPISTAIGDDGPYKTKLRIFSITQIPRILMGNPLLSLVISSQDHAEQAK